MDNLWIICFKVNIGCLNVRGLNNRLKRKRIFGSLKRQKIDICFLQETHSDVTNSATWAGEWGGKILYSHGTSKARGVATLISPKLDLKVDDHTNDDQGRRLITNIMLDGTQMTLCNLYAPNDDNVTFFEQTINAVDAANTGHTVIVGDFNLVLDPDVDCNMRAKNNQKSADYLRNVIEEMEFVDVWRLFNPDKRNYTWYRKKPHVCMSRLDFFLTNMGLCHNIQSTTIEGKIQSDHCLIKLCLEGNEPVRGPGSWKFRNTLLNNEDFVLNMSKHITHLKEVYVRKEPIERWELIKADIISFCREYSSKQAIVDNQERECLEYMRTYLQEGLPTSTVPSNYMDAIEMVENRIQELEIQDAAASAFRARAKWVREGEKSTKYFFALEKRNYTAKTMCKLKLGDCVITDQTTILMEQQKFYEELYTANAEVVFNIPNQSNIFINEAQKNKLDAELSVDELTTAVNDMKNDKALGCDGLSVNFFKVFWQQLKWSLLDLYRECFLIGELNSTAKKGLITLIPKKSDTTLLKNWRPLTLLNMDYKILAKVLALRMKPVLQDIIGEQQTGFMENRCITENIRTTIDLVSHVYQAGKKAIFVSIDYIKCFDRIEHAAVEGALRYFGFGDVFVRWTKLFFTGFTVCTTNSGHVSQFFAKTRGVNQGCPISPYLFLVCSEVMAHCIKQNKKVRGIELGGVEYVISQFADDTFLYLVYDAVSLQAAMDTFAYVEHNTGLAISYEKTTVYKIGSAKDSMAEFCTTNQLKWSSGDIELLGCSISNSGEQSNACFDQLINKVKRVSDTWYYRNFSLMGKVLIINALMTSLLVYVFAVMPEMSKKQIHKIEEII